MRETVHTAETEMLRSMDNALRVQTATAQRLQHALTYTESKCADLERQLLQARRWSNLWKHVAKLYRGASDASRADELRLRGAVSNLSRENGDLTRQVTRLQDALAAKDRELAAAQAKADEWKRGYNMSESWNTRREEMFLLQISELRKQLVAALGVVTAAQELYYALGGSDEIEAAHRLHDALAALDAQRAQGAKDGEANTA